MIAGPVAVPPAITVPVAGADVMKPLPFTRERVFVATLSVEDVIVTTPDEPFTVVT